jgi:AcrR family transcriptional regulator
MLDKSVRKRPARASRGAAAAAPAKPAPRTQETRSREAKERLLNATIEVLRENGYNGLSTKEVARRAGLSNGALVHHYASKAELVVAATAAVYDESILRGQAVARSANARRDPVKGFIKDCASVYFDWPFIAALEVLVVARTDAELMHRIKPVMENYRQTTNALWFDVFAQAGVKPASAELVLNFTLNMVRGMAVNRMWDVGTGLQDKLLTQWAKVATSLYVPELSDVATVGD